MKKFLLFLSAACFCIAVSAQDGVQVALRAGWSMVPVAGANDFSGKSLDYGYGLNYLYKDYHKDIKSAGSFGGAVDFHCNEWLTASLYGSWTAFSTKEYDGISQKEERTLKGSAISLVPFVRFSYLSTDIWRIYGCLGAGYTVYSGFPDQSGAFAVQFNPAGVEYGKKLFAYAEAGFGTLFMGVFMGVGYRF